MKRRYSSTVVGFPIPQHLRLMKHRQLSRKSLAGARAQVRATGEIHFELSRMKNYKI